MRALKVFREIPSSAAVTRDVPAGLMQHIGPPRSRTASSSELGGPAGVVVAAAAFAGATAVSPSASAVTTGSDKSSATRSIRLATSADVARPRVRAQRSLRIGGKVFADTP